jgi:hypothetical protein
MAFASVGTLGGGGFKATQTTMTLTLAAAAEAGNFVVLVVGLDDTNTDVIGSIVTSVTDSVTGNAWQRAHENTSASSAAGSSVSLWYCNVRTTIGIGGTITANFSSRGAGAITAWEFTKGAGLLGAVVGVSVNGGSATAMLSTGLNVTTPNEAHLRFCAGAGEEESTTTGTKTAAFTALIGVTGTSGTGGAAITNIILRGEYLISTSTGQQSAPTGMPTCDWNAVYVAFKEITSPGAYANTPFAGHEVPWLGSIQTIGT